MTPDEIRRTECPTCGAGRDQPCEDEDGTLFAQSDGWHLARRAQREVELSGYGDRETHAPNVLSDWYGTAQVERHVVSASSTTTTRGAILQHVRAKSRDEATGAIFREAQRLKAGFAISEILVMIHDPRGPDLFSDQEKQK